MARLQDVQVAILSTILHAAILATALLAAAVAEGVPTVPGRPPERWVVGVERGAGQDVALRLTALGLSDVRAYPDVDALEVQAHGLHREALAALPGVRYVEDSVRVAAAEIPADALYAQQSGYLAQEHAPRAWDSTQGDGVTIAVIDTGVDILHPDLAPNIWLNPGEQPNNGLDDDGDGCVDDVNGCAFVSDSSPGCQNVTNGFVNDDIGHGTFVAGVAAAAANGLGMVGVAPHARILPVKVLDCHGAGDSLATARGITYAARRGARVINLSLGGLEDSQVVRDAIAQATSAGAVVVAAAGNSGGAGVAFPARIPDVIAVGATVIGDPPTRARFSSYGPELDVAAAGQDVVGTVTRSHCPFFIRCISTGPWGTSDGTSFAAPQVSGLVALLLSVRPGLSPARVSEIVRASATASADPTIGAGRINMDAALTMATSNVAAGDPCTVANVIDGDSFRCADGRIVRMLQMDAPDPGECGGDWAKAALQYIFLTPGRVVALRYDTTRADAQGRTLAAPIWLGDDGAEYNIAIVMVYVGLAHAADVGGGNVAYHDWSFAAQVWAANAGWNMWAPGKPFNGGC
jgi:subtilisin family serine protease